MTRITEPGYGGPMIDPKLPDLLVEAGIATPEQAAKLAALIERENVAAWRAEPTTRP